MQQVSNMFIYNFTKQWLALTPDPLAKRLAPLALGIFFLPFPALYIKNLKLYPAQRVPLGCYDSRDSLLVVNTEVIGHRGPFRTTFLRVIAYVKRSSRKICGYFRFIFHYSTFTYLHSAAR